MFTTAIGITGLVVGAFVGVVYAQRKEDAVIDSLMEANRGLGKEIMECHDEIKILELIVAEKKKSAKKKAAPKKKAVKKKK